jgi:hypothetical protein
MLQDWKDLDGLDNVSSSLLELVVAVVDFQLGFFEVVNTTEVSGGVLGHRFNPSNPNLTILKDGEQYLAVDPPYSRLSAKHQHSSYYSTFEALTTTTTQNKMSTQDSTANAASSNAGSLSPQQKVDGLLEISKQIGSCMLTTRSPSGALASRAMHPATTEHLGEYSMSQERGRLERTTKQRSCKVETANNIDHH